MSTGEANGEEEGGDREARLRVDPHKVANARILLAAIDASVFGTAARRPASAHGGLIARLVAGLFADG
jgi:hypothetical protein